MALHILSALYFNNWVKVNESFGIAYLSEVIILWVLKDFFARNSRINGEMITTKR